VLVVGGGDTGSDCVGTSIRQGRFPSRSWKILPRPPDDTNPETPWPFWPKIMRTSSSQEEGCQRYWSALTKAVTGTDGRVTHLHGCEVDWVQAAGLEIRELPAAISRSPPDLILIAMGFVHVVHEELVEKLGVQLDNRGNVAV